MDSRATRISLKQEAPFFPCLALLLLCAAVAINPLAAGEDPSDSVSPEWSGPMFRQFDFWIGRWDVTLRIRQDDGSWTDSSESVAKIYSILDGKAILELWDEKKVGAAIRGYSLRYFDPEQKKWMLYLNWPGKNRSSTSSLVGEFRHGRGEFFATFKNQKDEEILQRYSFSDATPTSLRWDDAYSKDGGLTWSNNWIMEFTRTGAEPAWPREGEPAHTYYSGDRCDMPEFRVFEALEGFHKGKVIVHELGADPVESGATLRGLKVLDGCAVMTFLQYKDGDDIQKEFGFNTFQTSGKLFEQNLLDNRTGTVVRQLHGSSEDGLLVLQSGESDDFRERYSWKFIDGGTIELTVETMDDGGSWRVSREAFFGRMGSSATR
jgi:hypothetical protein